MTSITVEKLKTRLDAGEKLHVIDVREPEEYAQYNIGTPLIPLGQVQALHIEDIEELKDDELFFICRSGKRSATAALFLETVGFKNTVNVEGGVLAWEEKFGSAKIS